MDDESASHCNSPDCNRELTDEQLSLTMRTDAIERRAYECDCGAVFVTIVRCGA